MNIYARFFNQETLVHSVEELFDFLSSIPDINLDSEMMEDIRAYADSEMPYPKRYKIRPRVYFILIKTTAENLAAFKSGRKPAASENSEDENYVKKENRITLLLEEKAGWYKGTIIFKRVILIPGTTKFQYQDTSFTACVRTISGKSCYDRIIEHLKGRKDIDPRSQFPSARGQSFRFTYLGEELPENLIAENRNEEGYTRTEEGNQAEGGNNTFSE